MNESHHGRGHYLSKKLLESLGNAKPARKHFALMDNLLFNVGIERRLFYCKKLTEREISCLRLASLGKSASEIAKILNVKKSTVDSHYKKIKVKLRCKNITHAVFEGTLFGYLEQINK